MPLTPFHFGLGLALKGVAAPLFSWWAFAAAQVLIDCETLDYLVRREYPVHRAVHSFLGATAAGLVAAVLCLGVGRAWGRRWRPPRGPGPRARRQNVDDALRRIRQLFDAEWSSPRSEAEDLADDA